MSKSFTKAERVTAVRAVLFDLDGTLIDTIELIRSSMRHATETVLGAPLSDEILMRNVGVPLIQQMREFSPDHADELLTCYREHNHLVHDGMVHEYPGVGEALESLLEKGYKLGIVTSKSRPVAFRGLELFRLDRFFETIVAYDDVDIHKPNPHPLLVAAERIGVEIDRCAYVGDSPHDMAAAVAAGCVSIAATWGGFTRERVLEPGPDYVTDSMADVLAIFSGHEHAFRVAD